MMLQPLEILKQYWNYEAFRGLQGEIIHEVLIGKDVLALLPTGGGKSICYQIPGLALDGICIVVSPLVALMKDQVYQLEKRGIAAKAIFSGITGSEITGILNEAIDGKLKFLYVSPERLQTRDFKNALKYLQIGLLAVDEAHCISAWGHDFRPAYSHISLVRDFAAEQKFPIIAVTATATTKVRDSIIKNLQLKTPKCFVQSFARENLSYQVVHADFKERQLIKVLSQTPGPAIVYAKTRKKTKEISGFLVQNGFDADFYHAGLGIHERSLKQDAWASSGSKIMVATNAFGMGIDKSDVRNVVHMDVCESLEAYYQESGRAGRDGKPAVSTLLYIKNDLNVLEKQLDIKYPETAFLKAVYQSLAGYFRVPFGEIPLRYMDFDLFAFCSTYGLDVHKVFYAIKLIESSGLIYLSDSFFQSAKVKVLLKARELEDFQDRNPKANHVLKAILRAYGGEVFNSFMDVTESEIVSVSQLTYADVQSNLIFLDKAGAIQYIPQNSKPQFSFLEFRHDPARLPLNFRAIKELKESNLAAIKAIARYTTQEQRCRMAFIQDYFDEENPKACGKCDICLSGQSIGILSVELREKLLIMLPQSLPVLQERFSSEEKPLLLQYIKEELQKGTLSMDGYGLVYIN